jgi:hypothetical protein
VNSHRTLLSLLQSHKPRLSRSLPVDDPPPACLPPLGEMPGEGGGNRQHSSSSSSSSKHPLPTGGFRSKGEWRRRLVNWRGYEIELARQFAIKHQELVLCVPPWKYIRRTVGGDGGAGDGDGMHAHARWGSWCHDRRHHPYGSSSPASPSSPSSSSSSYATEAAALAWEEKQTWAQLQALQQQQGMGEGGGGLHSSSMSHGVETLIADYEQTVCFVIDQVLSEPKKTTRTLAIEVAIGASGSEWESHLSLSPSQM